MKVESSGRGTGQLVAVATLIAAIVGVTIYFVAYQGPPLNVSSSTIGSSASSSTTSISINKTNSASSSTATLTTYTGAVYIRACNCTLNLHNYLPDYSTMQDLASKSQAIIIANVTSQDTIGADDSSEFGGPGSVPLVPVTNYNVTITTVLLDRGWGLVPGHWTIIPTLGGTFNHITLNVTGFPTLSVGTTYVFFLTDEGPFVTGSTYYLTTTGVTQGLFYIKGGDVYSLDNVYPQADAWLPVKANGVPLADFITQVQSAAATNSSSLQK